MSDAEVRSREATILRYAQSHFNFDAVMMHMARFFLDTSTSDFECQTLTRFETDEERQVSSASQVSSAYRQVGLPVFHWFCNLCGIVLALQFL